MREGLRSSNLKKEEVKVGLRHSDGDLRRVRIPDLNLKDVSDDVISEEREKSCCEVSETEGKFNELGCEKQGLGDDEGKGLDVEDGGEKGRSSHVGGGEGKVGEEDVGGLVGGVDWSMKVCSTRAINDEERIDGCSGNVDGEQVVAEVQGLSTSVVSDDRVLELPSVIEKGLEDNGGKLYSLSVEDEAKKNMGSSRSNNVEFDGKIEKIEEHVDAGSDMSRGMQSNPCAQIESPEKVSVTVGFKCELDEVDGSERFSTEGKQERIQAAPKVLRSRVVPANDLGEKTEGRNARFSHRKRKNGTDVLREETVLRKDESSKSAVDLELMCDSKKRSLDHSEEELVEASNVQIVSDVEDKDENDKLSKSSERKGKRGRPRISRDRPEDEVVQMNEVLRKDVSSKSAVDLKFMCDSRKRSVDQSEEELVEVNNVQIVSDAEDKDENNKLSKSSERKGKRGRPKISRDRPQVEVVQMNEVSRKDESSKPAVDLEFMCDSRKRSIDHSEEELVEVNNVQIVSDAEDEDENKKLSKSSDRKGKRGRPKISRGRPEDEVVQMNEVKAVLEVEDEGLNSKLARSFKKKDGRGRPRKYANFLENEKTVHVKVEKAAQNIDPARTFKKKNGRGRPRKSANFLENEKIVPDQVEDEARSNDSAHTSVRKGGRGRLRMSFNSLKHDNVVPDKLEDEAGNRDSARTSMKKDGRGRPRKCANSPGNKKVVLGKAENEAGNNDSVKSPIKKDGRGRPMKSANGPENEKVAPIKVENEAKDANSTFVGSSTQRRISGRMKRSIDYREAESAQKKRKLSFSEADDENKALSNKSVRKSKKKGKRGRPKKELGIGALEIIGCDKDKVKNGVPSMKETRSDKKVNFAGLDKNIADNSKGEKSPLSAKRKRVEIAGSLSSEKNAIRNQIVDMLISAGWTIQYRPRQGREYNDAVYVNREGKTHWSVTKAYSALQQEVEEGKTGEHNFTFTPLPAEVLGKLFRVVSKTRSDKNKKKKHNQDGDTSDEDGDKSGSDKNRKPKHSALKRKPSVRAGTQGRRRCALVVRRSNLGLNSESDKGIAHLGKHSVLAWMIDSGIISLDGKVHYKNGHEAESMLEGSITRDGIHCCCCKEIISVSEFENHAGSKFCQPYENLYLESGYSLLQCLLDSWNKQEEAGRLGYHGVNVNDDDPNDDTCAICGDGGDLMCCDGCPSTFHLDCVDIEELPSGEWHCVYCSCKFCGDGGESATAAEEIDCDTYSSQLVTCSLCEEKYHNSCISEEDGPCVKTRKPDFCGKNCEQMSERLESLLGKKSDLGEGFSWTLLQRSDLKADSVSLEPQKIQNNSKLAVALSVMEECFLPIIDPRSGVNLIRHVVYSCGSNFNRLNFRNFLTVVLEKGDEVISAASIRIRGKQLAEMPFIGTRNVYRRQGMCRRLLAAIGQALSSLEIEKLVIPAIPELMDTWKSVFGFKPLEETVREELRSLNMVVFAHTDMLQKPIIKQLFGDKSIALIEKDADSGVSHNDCGADKTDANKPDSDDYCLNGKFDLNCIAPTNPDSSSDERHLIHPGCDVENCEDEVKSKMNFGGLNDARNGKSWPMPSRNDDGRTGVSDIVMNSSEVRPLQPDLNLMAENESLSDEKSHGHHAFDTMNSEVAKSTSNSSGLTNVKGCCIAESDSDQNGDSTSVRSSEERTLNPDLNLEENVLENNDSFSNSAFVGGPISRLDGKKSVDNVTQGDGNILEVTNCGSSQIVCCETGPSVVGQAAEINCSGVETSTANDLSSNIEVRASNLEENVLKNNDSFSNSAFVGDPISRLDGQKSVDNVTQGDGNILEVTNCSSSQILCYETGPLVVGQVAKINCSGVETSTANDLGSNTGVLPAGPELLSTKCSESLVVCTRVSHVASESSCNMNSAAGESCVAGIFHDSGIAKVGPTKS